MSVCLFVCPPCYGRLNGWADFKNILHVDYPWVGDGLGKKKFLIGPKKNFFFSDPKFFFGPKIFFFSIFFYFFKNFKNFQIFNFFENFQIFIFFENFQKFSNSKKIFMPKILFEKKIWEKQICS